MSQDKRLNLGSPLMGGSIGGIYGASVMETTTVKEIYLGNTRVTEEDLVKFHRLLGFMDFALSASEELRNLMVAYEAKQRILK